MVMAFAGTATEHDELPPDVAEHLPRHLIVRLHRLNATPLQLPSGQWVLARKRDLLTSLGRAGLDATQLRAVVARQIGAVRVEHGDPLPEQPVDKAAQQVEEMLTILDASVLAWDAAARLALVWPEVKDRPEDVSDPWGHVYINDLDDADKNALLVWMGSEEAVNDAATFPDGDEDAAEHAEEPAPGNVAALRDSGGAESATKRARRQPVAS